MKPHRTTIPIAIGYTCLLASVGVLMFTGDLRWLGIGGIALFGAAIWSNTRNKS